MKTSNKTSWRLLLALSSAVTVAAQTETEELIELPAFTVSSEGADRYRAANAISAVRVRTALIDTASSISVVTREFLNDIQPTRIYEATRYVAGVQEGRGITFGDRQIIRGFESEGRTVDNFLHSSGANFEESLIDRIEISKGPNAILAPGGVPGGAINVVTKSPSFTRQRNITALVGMFDAQKVTLDMTDKIGTSDKVAYRLIAAYQDTERYWSSDARAKKFVFSPQLTWRLSKNTELTLKYYYVDTDLFREQIYILDPSVGPDSEPILGPGFKAKSLNGVNPWSGLSFQDHVGQFQLTTSFNEHVTTRFAGRAAYFYEDSDQQFISTPGFTNRYNPYTGDLTQDYTWALNTSTGQYVSTFSPYYNPASIPVRAEITDALSRNGALQNDWVLTFNPRGVNLQTVAGWALSYARNTDQRHNGTLPSINLLNPGPETRPVYATAFSRDAETKSFNWQAYVNQRVSFFEERLSFNAGFLRYGVDTSSIDRSTTAPLSKLEDDKDMVLASVLYKVRPNASIYYSYSTNATPTIVNNAPLWREGKQHEAGGKLEFFKGRLAFNAAYFEISQTNVSVPNPERLVNPLAPNSLLSDLDDNGFEFELTGALTKELSVFGSYSHVKLRDALGRRVRSVADDLGSIMFNYKPKEGTFKGFTFNAGAVYTGKRAGDTTSVNFTPLNVPTKISFFIPGYTIYNAGTTYTWKDYIFRLSVENLTDDKDYVQVAGSRIATSTATGINVRLSATLKF